ncbi:MAG: 2OG-Fe(II) oxygenase [Candidatus Binatia bacterium]
MLRSDFFARFGMLVAEKFFDEDSCARLRREARSATVARAAVWNGVDNVVDETARRTARAGVSSEAEALVERRLLELKPRLERHFRLGLRGVQKPQFLIYRRGDFFECHTDDNPEPVAPARLKERQVSVVIFLNGEGGNGDRATSTGGALTFPGLIDDPRLKARGFPVRGESGLLIAFRSNVVHGVSPVVRGKRYTVVSWFF